MTLLVVSSKDSSVVLFSGIIGVDGVVVVLFSGIIGVVLFSGIIGGD